MREKIWRFAGRHFEMLFFLVILLAELVLVLLALICWKIGIIPPGALYFIVGAILAGDVAGILFWLADREK